MGFIGLEGLGLYGDSEGLSTHPKWCRQTGGIQSHYTVSDL